jgi:hypothetical protein
VIELLALLALLTAPWLVWVPSRRVGRRARAAGIRGTADERRLAVKALVRPGEAGSVCAGLLLAALAILTLAVRAVLGG